MRIIFQIIFLTIFIFFQIVFSADSFSPDRLETPLNASDLPEVKTLTHHGITWTFTSPSRIGRFVNGDYYVIGPVIVTSVDPPPVQGRNGSVLNLSPNPRRSGFDHRVKGGRFDPSLRASPPFRMNPGDSLISTISFDEIGKAGRVLRHRDPTISPVRSAAVLTCLAEPVPKDAFRPPYSGSSRKTIYYSRNLRRHLLPRLPKPDNAPSIKEYADYFERPWIDALKFNFDAPAEYMPDYGREIARLTAMAALLLCLDFPQEDKETLLVRFVQYGIDLFGLIQAGHPGWPAHGGHGNGRKLPVLLAGLLLNEPPLLSPQANFSEDMQTMYGSGWTGAKALYAGHVGKDGRADQIGWGAYEHLQPKEWPSTIGEDYRRCCTSIAWVGTALAARVHGLERIWRHPPFFDYVDRWMTEDDEPLLEIIEKQIGKSYRAPWARQGQAWDPFVESIFKSYWRSEK